MAVASPPPMHSEAMPRFWPDSSSADSKVASTRAPLAPIGWPSAVAPPWTLTHVVREAEVAHRDHRDAGEGLVDLEQVDVARLTSRRAPAPSSSRTPVRW